MASFIGNFVEWFDYASYGYFATIIAHVFFPDEDGSFLLPVKAQVRSAEDVGEGDLVEVIMELL